MHKNLVHAQESCACARILCMHKILVHAEESCACTWILCMHKILVHAHHLQEKAVFLPKHVFSRLGSIWKMGRSSGRQNLSRGNGRLFYFRNFPEKNRFSGPWTFHDFSDIFRDFWRKMTCSKNDPEVSGSARGASPTYPGPYLTHFDENRLKHSYYENSL